MEMKYAMALSLATLLFPVTAFCADDKPDVSKPASTQYKGEQIKGRYCQKLWMTVEAAYPETTF